MPRHALLTDVAQVLYAQPTANNLAGLNAYIAANTADGLPSTLRGQEYHIAGGSIEVDGNHIVLLGHDKRRTAIIQETPNIPIIKQDNIVALGGDARDSIIQGLRLEFEDEPTAGTTQQYAIQARPNADGDVSDGGGLYYAVFRDLIINNAYVGIGVYTTGGAAMPLWGSLFEGIRMSRIFHSALRLNGGGGSSAVGQPAVTVNHLSVINGGGAEIVTDGPCLDLNGLRGLLVNTLNVEDWHNEVFASVGGGVHVVNNLRLERHRLTGSTPRVIYCGNGQFIFNGIDGIFYQKATTYARLIYALASQVKANAIYIDRDDGGSTTTNQFTLVDGDPTASTVDVGGVRMTGIEFKEYLVSGWGPGLYCRTQVDGKAPVVDALPAPSATYRGRKFRIEGGSDTADAEKVCLKDAADAYTWTNADNALLVPAAEKGVANGVATLGADAKIPVAQVPDLSGTYAPASSVPTFNVKAAPYNATGDGTTDDRAAIQAALTAANSAGGGEVLLPAGVYIISAPLTYGSNVTVSGVGNLTVLKAKTGVSGGAFTLLQPLAASVTAATIRDMVVDQRSDAYSASTGAPCVSIDKTVRVTLENVEFRNVMTMAAWCDSPTATPCSGATIRDCRVVSSVYGGFSLFGAIIDLTIVGNKLASTGDDAIAVQSSASGVPDGVLLANNLIRACIVRGGGTATPHGILVMGASNASIDGNVIVGGTVASGIRLLAQGANVPVRTSITGNTIDQAGVTGATTTGVPGHGIHVSGASESAHAVDITIEGNTVTRSRQAGVSLTQVSRFAVDAMSTGNGTAGFRVDACTNGRISGGAVNNGSSGGEPYGVLLVSNSGTDRCTDVRVDVRSGDTRSGGARTQTHGIFISGADGLRNIIGGNLTGNVTAPLGGVAAGTNRQRIIGGGTPTIALGAGAGTGATGSVVGNDEAMTVTINTGTGAAAGSVAAVMFNFPYASAPVIQWSAESIQAVELLSPLYIVPGATSFAINAAGNPPSSQTLTLAVTVTPAAA